MRKYNFLDESGFQTPSKSDNYSIKSEYKFLGAISLKVGEDEKTSNKRNS
jgi:hypothetical protein